MLINSVLLYFLLSTVVSYSLHTLDWDLQSQIRGVYTLCIIIIIIYSLHVSVYYNFVNKVVYQVFLLRFVILSVYIPFSDRVGLPLHNIPSSEVLMKSMEQSLYDRMSFLA